MARKRSEGSAKIRTARSTPFLIFAACCATMSVAGCASKVNRNEAGGGTSKPSGGQQAGTSTVGAAGTGVPTSNPNGGGNSPATLPTPMPATTMPAANSGRQPADECVGTVMSAPPPANPRVDIIWVVDASGSMLDEQIKIGANLLQFADEITKANLDIRIVMLTTTAAIPVICPVTPSDPLAGSALATDPRYKFIESRVDSNNALEVAVDSYAMYSAFLRPDAATHFVIVTDDESRYRGQATPDARATAFKTDMETALGKRFTLHTISSAGPTACRDPNCMPDTTTGICAFVMLGCGAAAPGATYYMLADMTHGLTASICESDWKVIFGPLTAAVIESAPLPCNYDIPPPPKGETLDAGKVNVRWTGPMATSDTLLPRAASSDTCASELGWYYDDATAPKQILLCPHSCETIATGGTLNISFGCATVMLN
jgi:hypothetical protein